MIRLWKNWLLLMCGLWVMVLPWLGFPRGFKDILFLVSGFCVAALSLMMAQPHKEHGVNENTHPSQKEIQL
jgi:hypothetical protein